MKSFTLLALVGAAAATQSGYGPAPPAPPPAPPAEQPPCTTSTPPVPPPSPPSTCPAPGSTDSKGRYSCNPAHQYPAGQTCTVIDGCPYLVTSSTTSSTALPTATPSCPPPGSTDDKGRYSCNPAHQYPAGQTCTSMGGCHFLVYSSTTISTALPTATPSCPAPGSTDNKGRYSCNPAHQYPAGQTCTLMEGCYYLVYASTTCSTSKPTATPSCPPPGSTDDKGRYSCNPAHQYPAGQTCTPMGGCYFLVYPSSSSSSTTTSCPGTTTTTTTQPTATPSCPPAGSTDSKGRYSCNPAHAYPAGQTCELVDGCHFLKYPTPSTTTTAAKPPPTPSCPAAGSTDSKGRYSCNPAHQYPVGQTCELVEGCYYLKYPPTSTTTVATPKPTPSCPAAGSTDSKGRYSCNPAHAYPGGQTCELVDGCYYLKYPSTSTSTKPTAPTTTYTTTVETAYTTYCPSATTFTHQQKTYVITKATTITLPCPGGCTKTVPVTSASTTAPPKPTLPVPTVPVYKNTTTSQPPRYSTTVETMYTTYCPSATTFTHAQSTYVVTKATTLTLPCPGGCTKTIPVISVPTSAPTSEPPVPTLPVPTLPVPTKPVFRNTTTSAVVPPPTSKGPSPTTPIATTPTRPAVYTGAASHQTAGAIVAVVAAAALFL